MNYCNNDIIKVCTCAIIRAPYAKQDVLLKYMIKMHYCNK